MLRWTRTIKAGLPIKADRLIMGTPPIWVQNSLLMKATPLIHIQAGPLITAAPIVWVQASLLMGAPILIQI